jgi:hypothetical protein
VTNGERPRARELMAWKKSECVDCEFSPSCPQKLSNLILCYNEDGLHNCSDPGALIKRTIRFLCRKRKKERRDAHRGFIAKKRERWGFMGRSKEATITCSDMTEYIACQKSA